MHLSPGIDSYRWINFGINRLGPVNPNQFQLFQVFPLPHPKRWTDRRTGVWIKQGGTWVTLLNGPPQSLKLALALENQNLAIKRDTITITRMNRAMTNAFFTSSSPFTPRPSPFSV